MHIKNRIDHNFRGEAQGTVALNLAHGTILALLELLVEELGISLEKDICVLM